MSNKPFRIDVSERPAPQTGPDLGLELETIKEMLRVLGERFEKGARPGNGEVSGMASSDLSEAAARIEKTVTDLECQIRIFNADLARSLEPRGRAWSRYGFLVAAAVTVVTILAVFGAAWA